jgi:hypothetical protein
MMRDPARIICDAFRFPVPSEPGDWHDASGHHRYYGSSACNGGERIAETRRGAKAPSGHLRAL